MLIAEVVKRVPQKQAPQRTHGDHADGGADQPGPWNEEVTSEESSSSSSTATLTKQLASLTAAWQIAAALPPREMK